VAAAVRRDAALVSPLVSVSYQWQDPGPEQVDACPVAETVGRAEVDPAGSGIQDTLRQRGYVLGRAGEREPVQHLIRDMGTGCFVVAGRD
jgi:hypothetical protein